MNGMNKYPSGGVGGNLVNNQTMDEVEDMEPIEEHASTIPTIPPRNLQEFSTVSIFNAPEDLPEIKPPLGPYVTSKNIKLSKGELKLLSRDPKYSLIFPPNRTKMSIEIERMNSKIRYNDGRKNNTTGCSFSTCKSRLRITDKDGEPIEWNVSKKDDIKNMKNIKEITNPGGSDIENMLGDTLGQLFVECRDSQVYDPVENYIDFSTRRATDYKLNKNVILPKPMDSSKELQCELRRTAYLKAFDDYVIETENRKNIEIERRKKRYTRSMKNNAPDLKRKQRENKEMNKAPTEGGGLPHPNKQRTCWYGWFE